MRTPRDHRQRQRRLSGISDDINPCQRCDDDSYFNIMLIRAIYKSGVLISKDKCMKIYVVSSLLPQKRSKLTPSQRVKIQTFHPCSQEKFGNTLHLMSAFSVLDVDDSWRRDCACVNDKRQKWEKHLEHWTFNFYPSRSRRLSDTKRTMREEWSDAGDIKRSNQSLAFALHVDRIFCQLRAGLLTMFLVHNIVLNSYTITTAVHQLNQDLMPVYSFIGFNEWLCKVDK